VTGNGTCTYASTGEHVINIQGTFPAIYINNDDSVKDKILDVMQWGTIAWESMASAFDGASNLQISATDSPDVSNVTDMSDMFGSAYAFNQDISSWNVSNVTDMRGMFRNTIAFNQDLSSWDVSNVTYIGEMFHMATAFNQDLSSWDVSNVTNIGEMFHMATAFNQDLSSWDWSHH